MRANQPINQRDAHRATLGAAAPVERVMAKVLRIGCGTAGGGTRQQTMRVLGMDGSGTGMVIKQTPKPTSKVTSFPSTASPSQV